MSVLFRQEFFELVKSIGESRSKQEEDKIIVGEIAILKQHLSAPNISAKKMKDLADWSMQRQSCCFCEWYLSNVGYQRVFVQC